MGRRVRYLLEAAGAWLIYGLFRMLPMRVASPFGGWLLRKIGPHMGVHRVAIANLQRAFPEMDSATRQQTLQAMWDNLGRTLGELPHIPRLRGEGFRRHITPTGWEYVDNAKAAGKGLILFSGHFANWEIMPRTASEMQTPMTLIYRPPNNPYVDALIRRSRKYSSAGMYAKGREGGRQGLKTILKGGAAGMLVDQKMNDGIEVPFFGYPAMTAPAMAEIALKTGAALLPARVVRVAPLQFRVDISPPLETAGKSPAEIMQNVHTLFEQWIREYPAQWFWVHRRWPKM
ncbi:MAG: lysophospholipid acyltransferase family protein [Rickettsiales bacterium]|nr:lysophospholipid acyltransferase family protein [Rickettsiales bacterium]